MCKHFQLTCVEIRLCCKLQQFCCSCNSTLTSSFFPYRPISNQENFQRTENCLKVLLTKVENFQLQNFFRRKIFVGQSHFIKFSFCAKFSNIFLVVLEIRAKSILCQFVRDCFQRIGQNEGLCNDSYTLVIFLYTYK
jgi:hypothetical protein